MAGIYEHKDLLIGDPDDSIAAGSSHTELIGNEKDDRFSGTLGSIVQPFGGQYLSAA